MAKKIVLFLLPIFAIQFAHSQSISIREIIEKYLENSEVQADYTQLLDELEKFSQNQININVCTREELLQLFLITPVQADAIVSHRNKFGYYLHLAELQVAGFNPDEIRTLQLFLKVEKTKKQQLKEILHEIKHPNIEIISTNKWKKNIGFTNTNYLGNNWQQNLRNRIYTSHFSAGINAEKDAGEKYLIKGKPDFLSYHFAIKNLGKLSYLVLGDFTLNIGQGLLIGSGLGVNKGANVLMVKSFRQSIREYRSMNEYNYLRGFGTQIKLKKITFTIAASKQKFDGRLLIDSNTINGSFTGFDIDGYHRTESEISQKNNADRTVMGSWIEYNAARGNLGVGYASMHFNNPLQFEKSIYYLQYPNGNNQHYYNFYYNYSINKLHFFGENVYGISQQQWNTINGIFINLGKYIDAVVLQRQYKSGYLGISPTAFGVNSRNENGIYAGLKFSLHKKLQSSVFADHWNNLWFGTRNYSIKKLSDYLFQIDYSPTKKSNMYIRFRQYQRIMGSIENSVMKENGIANLQSVRVHFKHQLSLQCKIETRMEQVYMNTKKTSTLVFLDADYKLQKMKLNICGRITLYDINNYYARIYSFEDQLIYDFAALAYNGKGNSAYVLISKKIKKYIHYGTKIMYNSYLDSDLKRNQNYFLGLQLIYKK